MNKSDIKRINNNTYFYKDDTAVSLYMEFSFAYNSSRRDDMIADILSEYMLRCNSIYKTKLDISNKNRSLYNANFGMRNTLYRNRGLLIVSYRIIDYKILKEDYLDDALEYAYNMLYKPLFINDKLDESVLKEIKTDMYNSFVNTYKQMRYDINTRFNKTVLKELSGNINTYDTPEEYSACLDSINDKDIIDFYNKLLDSHYKTVFFGNYSNKDINKILSMFKFKNSKNYKYDFREIINLTEGYNEYVSKDFNQSVLFVTYRFKNMEKYSRPWFISVLNYIINNGSDGILFNILRTKYGLVYSCNSFVIYNSNVFILKADIDKKNKDKTLEVINEFFDIMNDREEISRRLEFAKAKLRESIYLSDDTPMEKFAKAWAIIFKKNPSDRGFIKNVNDITVDDVIDFINSLEDKNIFFYKGDKDE